MKPPATDKSPSYITVHQPLPLFLCRTLLFTLLHSLTHTPTHYLSNSPSLFHSFTPL